MSCSIETARSAHVPLKSYTRKILTRVCPQQRKSVSICAVVLVYGRFVDVVTQVGVAKNNLSLSETVTTE